MSGAGARDPARLVRPEVRGMRPYAAPQGEALIKLDAMENPHPFPGELEAAWIERLRGLELNRYPDADARRLKARIREAFAVPEGAGVVLGNGSDELIQLVILTLRQQGMTVLAPEPSFVMYRHCALAADVRFVGVELEPEAYALPRAAMLEAIERDRPAVVFLAAPNNPTGNLFDEAVVREIIGAAPGLVVIDEAYAPFAERTWLPALEASPNLAVMRTLSKVGLAGLRLGWLAAAPALIAELEKLRLPYNVSTLTQVRAEFALEHYEVLEAQARELKRARERLREGLEAIEGVRAFPSAANFVLVRVPPGTGGRTLAHLRAAGVAIKGLAGAGPLLEDCLRVTVGTAQENRLFLEALEEAIRIGADS